MKYRAGKLLPQIRIALAVTAVAATLQALLNPGKAVILGPFAWAQMTYLAFGLIKVLGFLALAILGARALYSNKTHNSSINKANISLLTMLAATLIVAATLFSSIKFTQSDSFILNWGAGAPQKIAITAVVVAVFTALVPLYRRQYYDILVAMHADSSELALIQGSSKANRQFIHESTKRFMLPFIPLLLLHITILKASAESNSRAIASLADGAITSAMALALAYAIANAHAVTIGAVARRTH